MGELAILIIEDDTAIREGVADVLRLNGYRTLEASNGNEGGERAATACYDLLLLDLMLPGKDGFEILQETRAARPTLPIIVLTARGNEGDRVRGLRLGADDYIVKPFSIKELLARIEAVLRRSPERPSDVSEVNILCGVVDIARCEVRFDDGRRSELSELETELLRYLASNPGRVISREELLARLWRLGAGRVRTRAVDMHITRLRKKLHDDPARPRTILTVRGRGYMLATGEGSE